MDTREGAMSAVSASNVDAFPATLPAAGEAAGHAVSIALVAVVAFGSVCGDVGELHRQNFARSEVVGWTRCGLVRRRSGVVRSWNGNNDAVLLSAHTWYGRGPGLSIST